MKRLVVYSALGLLAWLVLTAAWASAARMAGFPGPGETAAASMNLTARAVTVAELPGSLGVPQRVAARELRRAGHAMERLYRIPERSVGRFLDGLGDRAGHAGHTHRHVRRHVDRRNVRVDVRLQDVGERLRRRLEEARRRLEEKQRVIETRNRELERVQQRLERRHGELLQRAERGADGVKGQLLPLEVELEALERARAELDRARARLESELPNITLELSQLEAPDIRIEIPRVEVR